MQKFVIFTDPNKDTDDLITIVMLENMRKQGLLEFEGIITTHGNSETVFKRACFTQSILTLMGNSFKVCAGIGEENNHNTSSNVFVEFDGIEDLLRYADKNLICNNSLSYLKDIFIKASPQSLDILIISQMTDLCNFIECCSSLFLSKVKTVTIMGNFELNDDCCLPDNSANNMFDIVASTKLFNFLQINQVTTKFINRNSASQVSVAMDFFDRLNNDNKIENYIIHSQKKCLRDLYCRIINQKDLVRLTPEWFYKTFTNLKEEEYFDFMSKGTNENYVSILMNRVTKLNLYDPLTLIASIDQFNTFF